MRPVTSPDATSTTQPSHERHERARVSTPWEDQASSTPQRWQGATSSTTVWTSSSREGTHSNEPHDRRPATPVAGSTQAVTLADPMTELLNVDLALDVRVLVSACGVSAAGTLKFGGLPSVVDRTTTTLHIRRSDTTHGGSSYEIKSSRASRQTGLHHDQSTGLRRRGAEAGGRRPGLVGQIRSAATYRPVIATRDPTTVR